MASTSTAPNSDGMSSPQHLLRGPLLIGIVLVSLSLPYVIQLAPHTLLLAFFLCIGILLTLHDASVYLQSSLRRSIHSCLDAVVLDDVLRSIFDPKTGWIAFITSTFVGQASMYALPMTDEHRVRLLNSCLWTTSEQAEAILMQPGGILQMLPEGIKNWLNGQGERVLILDNDENIKDSNRIHQEYFEDEDAEDSDDSDENGGSEARSKETKTPDTPTRAIPPEQTPCSTSIETSNGVGQSLTRNNKPQDDEMAAATAAARPAAPPRARSSLAVHEEDPVEVMGAIIKDIVVKHMKEVCPSGSTMMAVGIAATLALHRVTRSNSRARFAVWMAAIAGTALTTLSRKSTGDALAHPQCWTWVSFRETTMAFLKKLMATNHPSKWKGWLALIVLWYAGLKKRRHSPT